VSAARLKTDFWIQACVRRADRDGIAMAVLRRGDPHAGAVLVRVDMRAEGCIVWAQTRTAEGEPAWFRGTGATPVPAETADAYIERHRARDPDIWVLDIDDRRGRLPFDDRLI
jgi:GMP synthase (glutamine-hydrolysing)